MNYQQLEVHSMAIEADRRTLSARAERGWLISQEATGGVPRLAALRRATGIALVRAGAWLQRASVAEAAGPGGPAVAHRPTPAAP